MGFFVILPPFYLSMIFDFTFLHYHSDTMEVMDMNAVWKLINELKAKRDDKNRLFLCVSVILFALLGGLVWLIIGKRFLPGLGWMICFLGYPAVFGGFLGGALFLYNHEFL